MIEFFTEFQGILTAAGLAITGVTSFFAGRRQRRINNFQKQQQIFTKQIEQFDELVKRQKENDTTGHTTNKKL